MSGIISSSCCFSFNVTPFTVPLEASHDFLCFQIASNAEVSGVCLKHIEAETGDPGWYQVVTEDVSLNGFH